MAGHSKWANIRHRKEAKDAKRGKIFGRLAKEIAVAVKIAGPDVDSNSRLRLALQNAQSHNMPKDNIERAIKRASGGGGADYKEVTYEGYGPGGIAVFIEGATDNPTRTVSAIRHYFTKYSGSLGKDGCLQFIFERKGIFTLKADGCGDEDDFASKMIDAGIEEIESESGITTLICDISDFSSVQKKLEELAITPISAGPQRIPTTTKEISPKEWETVQKFLAQVEDDDDVQKVYHNVAYNESFN